MAAQGKRVQKMMLLKTLRKQTFIQLFLALISNIFLLLWEITSQYSIKYLSAPQPSMHICFSNELILGNEYGTWKERFRIHHTMILYFSYLNN